MFTKFLNSSIGRLRLVAFLEGISLLLLVFIAMPLKYLMDKPAMVKVVGQAHGILFLLFVFYTLVVAGQARWGFFQTTWKVLLSSFIPFGTFYIDARILKPRHEIPISERTA